MQQGYVWVYIYNICVFVFMYVCVFVCVYTTCDTAQLSDCWAAVNAVNELQVGHTSNANQCAQVNKEQVHCCLPLLLSLPPEPSACTCLPCLISSPLPVSATSATYSAYCNFHSHFSSFNTAVDCSPSLSLSLSLSFSLSVHAEQSPMLCLCVCVNAHKSTDILSHSTCLNWASSHSARGTSLANFQHEMTCRLN